jgi:hypothetical protein
VGMRSAALGFVNGLAPSGARKAHDQPQSTPSFNRGVHGALRIY